MGKGGREMKPLIVSEENKELLSGSSYAATKLAPEDEWIAKLDHEAFRADVAAIGKQFASNQGPEDLRHLSKIIWMSRLCQYVGFLTMWWRVNPVTIFLLSLGCMTRWTIIGHHICHGGFDKCDKTKRYNRFTFGVGSLFRRCVDWLDWMLVEAWNVEHNQLHHYHLGETSDPDLVEHNMDYLREVDLPMAVKYVAVAWMAATWKWWYYAPNTFKQLKANERRRRGEAQPGDVTAPQTFDFAWFIGRGVNTHFSGTEFLVRVLGPFFVQRFVLFPLPILAAMGWGPYRTALLNLWLAEICTNCHSFLVIATNHAGSDLYRFEKHCKPRSATFYLRQVVNSANFACGDDITDFLHGFLNYQVEHHLWPDLSMRSYQKAQPIIQALCAKHGVPYVKESVFKRLWMLVKIMVGTESHRKFPAAYEHAPDIVESDGH
jgi:fatty acid desaturase